MPAVAVSQPGDRTKGRVIDGLNLLVDAAGVTLGPQGRYALYKNGGIAPTATRDGGKVAGSIELRGAFENMGAQLVKEAASNTTDEVGDGATTAALLAQALVREGVRAIAAGSEPTLLLRGIDDGVGAVVRWLEKASIPCEQLSHIVQVATSAAKDSDIGERIADALHRVGVEGEVVIDDGNRSEDELEFVLGLSFDGGYASPYFINDQQNQRAVLNDCLVLLIGQRVSDIRELLPALESVARQGRSLLIVAEEIEGEALATLVVNNIRGIIKVAAVRVPGAGGARDDMLEDLAVVTGARVISSRTGTSLKNIADDYFGAAKQALVYDESATVVEGGGSPDELSARRARLRQQLEASTSDFDKRRIRQRLRTLSDVAVIRVTAPSEIERAARKERYQSALHGSKAAMESGVVPGGGTALLKAQAALDGIVVTDPDQAVGVAALGYALEEPFLQIVESSATPSSVILDTVLRGSETYGFDANTGEYCDVMAAGIVDSAKVTQVALQNAASVARLILTSEVFIAEARAAAQTPFELDRYLRSQWFNSLPRTLQESRRAKTRAFNVVRTDARTFRVRAPRSRTGTEETQAVRTAPKRIEYLPERHVNTCFVYDPDGTVVPGSRPLLRGSRYALRVDIGPLRKESLVRNPERLNEKVLPSRGAGHWLEIVFSSDELQTERIKSAIYLPSEGASWTCHCPYDSDHTCKPSERSEFLHIPFLVATERAKARVRLVVYYRNSVLQSQFIGIGVNDAEVVAEPAQAFIDYSASVGLRNIPQVTERTVNILTNDADTDSHRLIINSRLGDAVAYVLTEGQMRSAMANARRALVDIHIAEGMFGKKSKFRGDNTKPFEQFQADLSALASRGRELWTAVFPDRARIASLKSQLRTKSVIQIARTSVSRFVFPWAMLYDFPLEVGNPDAHVVCDFAHNWYQVPRDGRLALQDLDECPYAKSHTFNTICPFGFWGFRHVIEQPPSTYGWDLPQEIRARATRKMLVGVSRDLTSAHDHLHEIQMALGTRFNVDCCDTREAIASTVDASPQLEFLYFYCHGRHRPQDAGLDTYLEVGDRQMLCPADIGAWNEKWIGRQPSQWEDTTPLVFINGCHTTDLTPDALVSFVEVFMGAHAAGVIGTETTVHENVASEAAEVFWENFCSLDKDGKPRSLGEALRNMRFGLLRKGNLMGLTYTAYCSAGLTVSGPFKPA